MRHLIASTDLTAYLDWPGRAQVCRLERTWREHGLTLNTSERCIMDHQPTTRDRAAGPPPGAQARALGYRE